MSAALGKYDGGGGISFNFSIQCWYKTTFFYTGEVGVDVEIISTMTVKKFLGSTNKVQKREKNKSFVTKRETAVLAISEGLHMQELFKT